MNGAPPKRDSVWRPFDEIAPTYDLVNRIVSFGRDVAWRSLMARRVAAGRHDRVLDLAAGTGDVALAIAGQPSFAGLVVGADLAMEMMVIGQRKVAAAGSPSVCFTRCDAQLTAFDSGSFDVATMAFGLRNVGDLDACLREIRRVLKPGGRALILEFSLPRNGLVRGGHLFYLRHVLPYAGGIISGSLAAYRYLNRSIEAFPYGEALCERMRAAGFSAVRHTPVTFGVATLYEAVRPESGT